MWGFNKKKITAHNAAIEVARADQLRTDVILAKIESQEPEINDIVNRLQRREKANNFGEALMLAMERRAA